MSKLFGYLFNMIPYMLCSLPVIVLARMIAASARKKVHRQTTAYHEIGLCFFILFLVGLASQTMIPKLEFGSGSVGIVDGNLTGKINLIPGQVFIDIYHEWFQNGYSLYFVINFVGNILLFFPIGFCIPLLWNRITFKKVLLIAVGSSLFIEICQLPQARGTDIDDVWINTLGACIGYTLYRWLEKRLKGLFFKFKISKY